MTAEIQIRDLFKKYPSGTEALKGINLEIKKGQFFTLLGPNGAGKSTLVKIMTTLVCKDSGSFVIAGIVESRFFRYSNDSIFSWSFAFIRGRYRNRFLCRSNEGIKDESTRAIPIPTPINGF